MKKLFFVIVSLLVGFAYSYAQPTLLEHVTFENGIPNNWTASSSQYVLLESEIASSGEKCLHMKPNSSQAIMLTSPVYNITPGRNVRLEFSQLPIISSPTNGARIEVKTSSMSDWEALTVPGSMNSPGDIDRTFGGGEKQFSGEFYTSYYWSQDDFGSSFGNNSISTQQLKTYLTDESNYYFQKFTWKHTVFYLTNYLESTDNSFQIRFVVPKGVNSDNGWFIDDVRLFVSSVTNEDIRVPQISQKLAYPAAYNYPNCSDVEISFNLQDRNGSLNAEEDSIYIEYYVEGNSEIHRTPLVHDVNMKYTGYIPFLGVDSVVCWRAVINDHKNNTLTYPFPYGTFLKFKSVIPYVGDTTITSTGTSQGEMFINVNSSIDQAKYQMRYTANELLNAGFKPGTIAGIYLNITQAAGVGGSLHDFSLKMGTVASAQQLSNFNPYLGVSDVYSNQQYVIPGPGWTYFPFDEDKYFQWDGVSDIVFTVCYSGRTSSNGSLKVECIPATGNAVTYKVEMPSNDYLEACVTTFDATNPSMNIKPNFKFNFINTCFFEYDAGIMNTTIGGIPNAMNCTTTSEDVGFAVAGQSYPVKVKLRNYGTSNITATDVYWMIDGDVTTKQSYTWTGNLAPNYEQEITITNSLNLSAGQHTLAVWTELTNNSIRDWNMQNDTAFFTIIVSEGSMSGNYAIGGTVAGITPTRTFETFDDAFLMLMNCGVSGPVTFKVKGDSVYTVPVVIPDCINGLSATNYITFESADSGNPTKFATVAYNNLGNIVAPQTPTFDLSGVEHIRLKNFLIKPTAAQYLIKMSNTTNDIYLEDIKFESFNSSLTSSPSNPDNAAFIGIGAASDVVVDNCTFNFSDISHPRAVYVKGFSPTDRNHGIEIKNSHFNIGSKSALYVEYNNGIEIKNNEFVSVFDDDDYNGVGVVNYVVNTLNSTKVSFEANKVALKGMSALSMSDVNNSRIANNLISIYNLSPTVMSNYVSYGVNMVSGSNDTIVYNNVYGLSLNSNEKRVVGMSLGSDGETTAGNILKNNIFVSDGYGFAVILRPSSASSFSVSNNMYYKTATIPSLPLLSYNGATNTTETTWQTSTGDINSSYNRDPMFVSWNDLYSTIVYPCTKGVYIPNISKDFYGNTRPTDINPCIGAREYTAPKSNIHVLSAGLTSGNFNGAQTYSSCNFENESVFVTFTNLSNDTIATGNGIFKYRVNNSSPVSATFSTEIIPDSVYTFVFPTTYDFSVDDEDGLFRLTAYSDVLADTINDNDTAFATIFSFTQMSALPSSSVNVDYGETATLNVVSQDSIYWYYNMSDEEPFLKSQTFTTGNLYHDTAFYFSRKSEIPVLKISEIQFISGVEGATPNMPSWADASNNVYEISNFGSGAINIGGYKFAYVRNVKPGKATDTLTLSKTMTKTYTFPTGFVLGPNSSVWLVNKSAPSGNTLTDVLFMGTGTGVIDTNGAGFILMDKNSNIVDAVSINYTKFHAETLVPSTIWSGSVVTPNTIAQASGSSASARTSGIIRNSTEGINPSAWTVADASHLMTIGEYNDGLTLYKTNDCFGSKSTYNVIINDPPAYEISLTDISLANGVSTEACGLTDVAFKIRLVNMGAQPTSDPIPLVAELYENDVMISTFTENYTPSLYSDTAEYTLAGTFDLSANDETREFTVVIYSNLDEDEIRSNDTVKINVTSVMTPLPPQTTDVTIDYATSATITADGGVNRLVWYDSENSTTPLYVGDEYETPILYENTTYYVESLQREDSILTVGTGTTTTGTNANTAYPGPFNGKQQHVKEQYLYRASDLISAGLEPGNINSIAFNVQGVTLGSGQTSAQIQNYRLKIGQTSVQALSSWQTGLTEVYTNSSMQFSSANTGWYTMDFTTPFVWDGESNIVVEVCFESPNALNTVKTYYASKNYSAVIAYRHASNDACSTTDNPTGTAQKLPNIRFGIDVFGCNSSKSALNVNVLPPPGCEVALEEFISPAESTIMSGVTTPITVLLKNNGLDELTSAEIELYIGEDDIPYTYWWSGSLASGFSTPVVIRNHDFEPGALTLKAVVIKDCDNIPSNDTIEMPLSVCVGNNEDVTTYVISPFSLVADYETITEAIEDLKVSGICGPIVFDLRADTLVESFTIPRINGLSEDNTITFTSTSYFYSPIIFTDTLTTASIVLDSAEYITFKDVSFATTKAATLMEVKNSKNIKFENVTFFSVNNANLVNLSGQNENIIFQEDSLYSGKNLLTSSLLANNLTSSDLTVSDCFFGDFALNALGIASFENVKVLRNKFRTYAKTDIGKAISLRKISGDESRVEANNIYMQDGTKVREGIEIKASTFSAVSPLLVFNNAISIKGSGSSGIKSLGIDVDTSSAINFYYNSVLMAPSTNSADSRAMNVGKGSSNIVVRNNNFDNAAKGFAYYVEKNNIVTLSNNNNYVVNGNKFAYWNSAMSNLAALRNANSMDDASDTIENPFTSDSLLSLIYPSGIESMAEPIEGITKDIIGYTRPISPKPTVGAYQFVFNNNDAGVTEIISPNPMLDYVENEPMTVEVKIKNFGNYSVNANELMLVAALKYSPEDELPIQVYTETYPFVLLSMDTAVYTFNATFTPPINNPITKPLYLEVYSVLADDENPLNDTSKVEIEVLPAYNLQAVTTANITERCKLLSQPVTMTIKNVGAYAIQPTDDVYLSYEVEGRPDLTVTEQLTFPYDFGILTYDSLQPNLTLTYVFNQPADFYPLGDNDTVWKLRTFVTFVKDNVQSNDTTAYVNVTSRVSPPAPEPLNDTIFYGTIGHPSATQTNHLAIKYFLDSTDVNPFYTSNYNNSSQKYPPYTTPNRTFEDSTYYIRVNLSGSYPCESFFSEVKIVVKERQPVDMAAVRLSAPLHTLSTQFYQSNQVITHVNSESSTTYGSVYTTEDTVKFIVVNYGTQPASNFNMFYSIESGNNSEPIIVSEVCTETVQPDQEYEYTFTTLADMSDPSKTYKLRGWVVAANDATPLNDTTEVRQVKPLNGNSVYGNPVVREASSMDITRVQLANLDNSSIAGDDTYSNFTTTVEPATMFQGTSDTLIIQYQNASSMAFGLHHSGWIKVYVDWNRNGDFEGDDGVTFYTNHYPNWELVYSDTVYRDQNENRAVIHVPEDVHTGLTRMRIILSQEDNKHTFMGNNVNIDRGEVEDYLLEILPIQDNNAQIVRFVNPSETFQTSESQNVKVRLRNSGQNNITAADIHWFINGEEQELVSWTGNLATSESEDVTLGTVETGYGTTNFLAYVDLGNDEYQDDDTSRVNIFRFKTFSISYEESFDDQVVLNDDFYPYEININKPENCWQFGMPNSDSNSRITESYSYPYCWKTNLNGSYPKNNRSILYTPVFDIELIKPDTLSFMLYRSMGTGASMIIEYLDYQGQWQILGAHDDDGNPDTNGHNWYNNASGFTGTSTSGWTRVTYSLDHLVTNMGITAQFRFIFSSGSSSPSDGVAIDDFGLKKGLRDQDAGVTYIELAPSILPNYGQDFYPKVTIHNFGREELSSFRVCYLTEDTHIPVCEDVNYYDNGILPGHDTVYTFQSGHYLDVDMPDPFSIIAFTRLNPVDLYSENDSAWANIVIGPLQKDVAVIAIEQPTQQIVANDDVEISVRIRNYGLDPITELPISYIVTGTNEVREVINFNPPLYNGDEYIYRFNQRYHASFGSVNLKVWTNLDGDYYHDNDTIYKRLQGSNYTQDLEARYITIDDYDQNSLGVQLTFLNRSSIGVGDITVGYYYNGDVTTAVEETYRIGNTLPAGEYGHHYFSQKLPRNMYQSICAYVKVPNEVNLSNDTTCTLMIGFNDGAVDTLFIEETVAEDCLIQLVGHNEGTLGGDRQVVAHLVVNGDWNNVITQTFNWQYDEPNVRLKQYMTFSYKIPKSSNGEYDVLAWIDYPRDFRHWNDTTRIYEVKSYVGLEDAAAKDSEFTVEQNVPNPYETNTDIAFYIPQAGKVAFRVSNTLGQVVYSSLENYSEGRHTINFDGSSLDEGVYYYVLEYNSEQRVRKMIIVR